MRLDSKNPQAIAVSVWTLAEARHATPAFYDVIEGLPVCIARLHESMQIFVTITGGKTATFGVRVSDTIANLEATRAASI
eukprot:1274300-Karenia_brevis.AAC.1